MTLTGFVSHGRIKWIESIFAIGVRPSFFYHGDVSADVPVKVRLCTASNKCVQNRAFIA